MRNLILRFKSKLKRLLGLDYHYIYDGLKTKNNTSFIKDESFIRSYERALKASNGADYKIPMRVHQAIWCAHAALGIEGDFIELGTGKGFIFSAILESIPDKMMKGKSIYLVDTFLPYKTDIATGEQHPNQPKSIVYSDGVEQVSRNFSEWENIIICKGKAPEVLEKIIDNNPSIAFIHVDLNYSLAEIDSLDYLWEYISPFAIILLDDYANPGREEQYESHNSFFASKGLKILTLASGQGLVIKSH